MVRVLQWGVMPGLCGGVENFVMNAYRAIDRSRVQFDFLLYHDSAELYYEDEIERLGGRVFRVCYGLRRNPVLHFKSLYSFFRNHGEIGAVHFQATALFDCDPIYMASLCGVPVRIIHSHNTDFDRGGTRACLNAMDRFNRRASYRFCSSHLACSEAAGRWMFLGREFQVFKNGVDVDRFRFDEAGREAARSELAIGGRRAVLCVARLEEQKNPLFLADIAWELERLQPGRCLVLVAGDGALRGEMERRISSRGIPNLRLLGNRQDVERLMWAADVLVLPSIYEGFPISLVEAQASGLPAVVSADGVPREADVTGLLKFLPLGLGARAWAEAVVSLGAGRGRAGAASVVREKGYDIWDLSDDLASLYEGRA